MCDKLCEIKEVFQELIIFNNNDEELSWLLTFYMETHLNCISEDAITAASNALANNLNDQELKDIAGFIIYGLNAVKLNKCPAWQILRDDGRVELTTDEEKGVERLLEKVETLTSSEIGKVTLTDRNHVALILTPKYFEFCSKRKSEERDY